MRALALPVLLAVFGIAGTSPLTMAQAMAVPVRLQATILHKLFSYDRALQGHSPTVLIVSGDPGEPQAQELKTTLTRLGDKTDVTTAAALPARADGVSAVYIMPGQWTDAVSRMCAQHGILSMSGVSSWAEQGRVSIAIGIAKGKPEIVVNLTRTKAEGHDLSSRVLRLARVIL